MAFIALTFNYFHTREGGVSVYDRDIIIIAAMQNSFAWEEELQTQEKKQLSW
jgi:hypothetical protein